MKKKLLCGAVLGAICMAQAAMAQDFDDRWYVSGTVGGANLDSDRVASNGFLGGIGIGKQLNRNFSLDFEYERYTANADIAGNLDNKLTSGMLTGRVHFPKEGRSWAPYLVGGLGVQNHDDEFLNREGSNMVWKLGAGLQANYDRIAVRTEVGARVDFDEESPLFTSTNRFTDWYGVVSLLVKLGDRAAPPAPPAPAPAPAAPQVSCADLDDDGDGVNNCSDRCPNSQAGQTIGADGCPVQLTIDLKGVNFDFDKDSLRPDAVAILDEAVAILQRYPQLRVEVAGHTDSRGKDAYNQALSQRRAKVVYDYLTGHGIDAGRLAGPNGFGESRPIAPNENADGSDNPDGRAKNRRTELNVQN